MCTSPETLKSIYQTPLLVAKAKVLWLMVVYLFLFLALVALWPVAWIALMGSSLILPRTPWSKSFDEWCFRLLLAPRHALIPETKNQQLN